MKYLQLTRGKFTIIDDEDFEWLNQWKWYFITVGYAMRYFRGKYILMHRQIIGKYFHLPDNKIIDHINQNSLDNRKINLRIVGKSENAVNSKLHKNNTSGHRGIWWDKQTNKWAVEMIRNYKKIWLGRFFSKEEAIEIYDRKLYLLSKET